MKTSSQTAKKKLYLLVGILFITSIAFRVINSSKLEQTSLLFVGLPTLMTLLVIKYSTAPKTIYGITFKVITLFLLMSSILFGEGVICVLIAAPIFYASAFLIVFVWQWIKKRKEENKAYSLLLLPVLFILFQPQGILKTPEVETVTVTKDIGKKVSLEALHQLPDFKIDYPTIFKMGFPQPISITGQGMNKGDQRQIQFLSRTKGVGTLSLEIDSVSEQQVVYKIIQDDTHMNHWLTWKKVKVEINTSQVTWTSEYTCDLGPQWYFKPIEKWVVTVMNEHLIHSYFERNRNN
ncbi:hypothetical protein [Flammeovirga pacifica]|uniref:Uncharacterized protein n=1 Tax=Flammeovirga pacifica TaxID=915059 RepID=A0A1S1YUF9_FLAPC|nr:hypothetical protein [Flammeovirga pacifica]OHX64669.1 hypothetical protein NH26_24180 [Flammeovirga pacifica]